MIYIYLTKKAVIIKNELDKNDEGIYDYAYVNSIKLQFEQTNWFITILSFVFGFIGGYSRSLFKDKDLIIFN